MRGEFKGFFIMKQIYNEALTELFSTTSRVYPLHFFRSTTLAAFGVIQLQQNRAQSRDALFVN